MLSIQKMFGLLGGGMCQTMGRVSALERRLEAIEYAGRN